MPRNIYQEVNQDVRSRIAEFGGCEHLRTATAVFGPQSDAVSRTALRAEIGALEGTEASVRVYNVDRVDDPLKWRPIILEDKPFFVDHTDAEWLRAMGKKRREYTPRQRTAFVRYRRDSAGAALDRTPSRSLSYHFRVLREALRDTRRLTLPVVQKWCRHLHTLRSAVEDAVHNEEDKRRVNGVLDILYGSYMGDLGGWQSD